MTGQHAAIKHPHQVISHLYLHQQDKSTLENQDLQGHCQSSEGHQTSQKNTSDYYDAYDA